MTTSPGFLDWFSAAAAWLGALGSASAAIAAVWLGRAASKRADAAQQEARASRAAVITARIEWTNPISETYRMTGLESDDVRVENHGDSPIFVPRIEAISDDSSTRYSFVRTNEEIRELYAGEFDPPEIVRGGGHALLPFELRTENGKQINAAAAKVTISFRDVLGTKWVRVGMEAPRPVADEPDTTTTRAHPPKGTSLSTVVAFDQEPS